MSDLPLSTLPSGESDGTRNQEIPAGSGRVVWMQGDFDDRAWRLSAACRDVDLTVFFPVGVTGPAVEQIAEAKAICQRCPVRLACLQFALVSYQEYGVWGGCDEEERREMRRQWRRRGRPLRLMEGVPRSGPGGVDRAGLTDQPPEAC